MLNYFSGWNLIYTLLAIILSLSIHESMHAYAAHLLGDDTAKRLGRVSFNPIRHIDPVMTILLPLVTLILIQRPFLAAKPVPFDPGKVKYNEFGGAIIAAAGPVSNLILAIIGALILKYLVLATVVTNFLIIFTELNVSLFVFNILPIPPLDGSRVLYAFSPEGVQDFMRRIEPYGLFIIFTLVIIGGASNFLVTLNNDVLRMLP